MSIPPYQPPTNNPYQSVASPSDAQSVQPSQYEFRSIKIVGVMVAVLTCCIMACRAAMLIIEIVGCSLSPTFLNNAAEPSETELPWLFAYIGVAFLMILVFLLQAVAICFFYYRTSANLHSAGVRGLQHTPGWCAGWWFVPLANLFKPYHVTKEFVQASEEPHGSWASQSAGLVTIWWLAYIVGNLVDSFIERAGDALSIEQNILLVISVVTTLLNLIAGVCFLLIIFNLINLHEKFTASAIPDVGGLPPQFPNVTQSTY